MNTNQPDWKKQAPLSKASVFGHTKIVSALLSHSDLNVNRVSVMQHCTPFNQQNIFQIELFELTFMCHNWLFGCFMIELINSIVLTSFKVVEKMKKKEKTAKNPTSPPSLPQVLHTLNAPILVSKGSQEIKSQHENGHSACNVPTLHSFTPHTTTGSESKTQPTSLPPHSYTRILSTHHINSTPSFPWGFLRLAAARFGGQDGNCEWGKSRHRSRHH